MLEVGDYESIFEEYGIKSYPTMKFFDAKGEVYDFEPSFRLFDVMITELRKKFNIKKK
jgi:hypothetical protein